MQRTPTTPNVGVNKRRYRAGQDRLSGTVDQGISVKVVREHAKSTPPGNISLEEARELLGIPNLTDEQVEEIKEQVRFLVEVIYEKWLQDRSQNNGRE